MLNLQLIHFNDEKNVIDNKKIEAFQICILYKLKFLVFETQVLA